VVALDPVGVEAGGVVDEAGVDEAGVDDDDAAGVEPPLAFELVEDPRISDSENVTGNGQPPEDDAPAEADGPELEAPPSEVDDNDTELTPVTRPSATIVAATADCVAAQPEI
jgi:hypothetical protein